MPHRSSNLLIAAVFVAGCSQGGQSTDSSASAHASAAPSGSGAHRRPVGSAAASGASGAMATPVLAVRAVPLFGATPPTFIDYLIAEPGNGRVWVPIVANGTVDVYDGKTGGFAHVDGLKTAMLVVDNKKRPAGPNAVTIGDGFAYVGNRATNEVCAIELATLKLGSCLKVVAQTDNVAYVASAKEVWVTTPRDSSVTVLDAAVPGTLKPKQVIKVGGQPEGFAVDNRRGIYYTNLIDKGSTLSIDVKTHKVTATWNPDCGENGPRGLALDIGKGFVFVSCTDHVQAMDGQHQGAYLGKLDTGAGVDKIAYREDKGLLYAASGKTALLQVAHVDDKGILSIVATAPAAPNARSVILDDAGTAYIADIAGAELLVIAPLP